MPNKLKIRLNYKADGEQLSIPLDWNELSMKEKAAYIRMGVANGYKDIDSIKEVYNEFKCGGYLYGKGGKKQNDTSVPPATRKAIDFFMSKGLTDYLAAGLVGNLIRESQLNPNAVNKFSGAYGIAQWLGSRKDALFNKYGQHPTLDLLLDFVWRELNSTHKSGLKNLKLSTDPYEAARNAFGYYEFSVGPEGAIREMNKYKQDGQASMDEGIRNAHNVMMNISKDISLPNDGIPQFKYNGLTDYDKSFIVDDETLNRIMNLQSNNTTLDTNIPFQQTALVKNILPEVTVTPEKELHYYIKSNPQELLDLMNSMMVPYELPEIPKPITATERLAKLNLDKNSLLLQDLENSILRASRFGTPLDEVKLARDVKDLQFYRNMSANGGNLFLIGGPLVDATMKHIYDGTTEDNQQMNDDYIFTGAPSQYDFQVIAEAPIVYWDGFNWVGFNDLGQRVNKGSDFNSSGARIIENPQEFENARLAQTRRKDINGTHRFAEDIRNFTTDLVMMPAGDILAEPLSTVGTKIASKIAKNIFKKGVNNTILLADNMLMHNDNVRFLNIVDNPQSITIGDEITNNAIERGRNKLINWIESPFYKQRIMDEPLYTQSLDIIEDASQLIKNADINLEDRYVLNPTGETNGITLGNAVLKTILNNGTELIDADTGLTINIADDLSFNADDTTLHELLHYMTNNSKGSPTAESARIVNGDWLSHPETHYDAINKIFRSKSSRWQDYVLDLNDSLLPKYDKVVKLVMENPEEAVEYLKKAGRSETDAINAINSLKSRYKYLYDTQELRAFLQELFLSKILPNLKNPNSALEIELFLVDNPTILENFTPYQLIQEIRPGTLKDYAKYFSAALGTLPLINKSVLNGK